MKTTKSQLNRFLTKLSAAASLTTWTQRVPTLGEACVALGLMRLDANCAAAQEVEQPGTACGCHCC